MKPKALLISVFLVVAVLSLGYWKYFETQRRSEGRLLERAHLYWEALRVNDLYTQYQMLAETAAGTLGPDQFEKQWDYNTRVSSYVLGQARINGDRASIGIETQLTMPDFRGKTFRGAVSEDRWTFIKGDWYHGWIEDDETEKNEEKPSESAVPSV